jgi:hydrogenase maturation protease
MTAPVVAPRVIVAGMGNVLRGDDGFGVVVLEALKETFAGDPSVTLVETGIAGVGLVQHLMDGFDTLIIVDAVQRGVDAGQVLVLEPTVSPPAHDRKTLIDTHQTDAEGVMRMASAIGCLPAHVWIVGCQAEGCDDLGAGLSEPVRAAIPEAVSKVRALVASAMARDREFHVER